MSSSPLLYPSPFEQPPSNSTTIPIPQHNTFHLPLLSYSSHTITLSSSFDSGNLLSASHPTPNHFLISPCPDIPSITTSKTWFYFKASGFPPQYKAKFTLTNMNCLHSFGKFGGNNGGKKEGKEKQYGYRPCRKVGKGNWEKFEDGVVVERVEGDTQLRFQHTFMGEEEEVAFAFTYPYQYGRYLELAEELEREYGQDEQIFFKKEIVTRSLEDRPIFLFTISSSSQKNLDKSRKPIVMITSRVHPGQVPSSYTTEGIIKFLLSKRDLRAHILRRMFSFKIVPMLNPDGVYRGHYRMDSIGQNLNRYYNKDCCKEIQPAVFAMKGLIQKYSKEEKLLFYFDLHAHAGRKGAFIYGNSIANFIQQVEANVLCRVMALNTPFFEYSCCNFSQKHMTHKDKNEELTKNNCGRVFAYKSSGIIHSFTLELGYHFTNLQTHTPASNTSFQVGKYHCIQTSKPQSKLFTPQSFYQIGQSLMISILDCLNYNPYTKIPNGQYQSLALLRRVTAFNLFQSDQKYKTFDMKTYPKVKNINSIINQSYYDRIEKNFKLGEMYKRLFLNTEWSNCVEAKERKDQKTLKIEEEIVIENTMKMTPKRRVDKEDIKTIQDEILSQKSENSSESGDTSHLIDQMRQTNSFHKNLPLFKTNQLKRQLIEINHMKYGSSSIAKNQLPILQSRGATPTTRHQTAEKDKKSKAVLEIHTLKLKIKQQFAKELKSQLSREQNNVFNGSKLQRREHRSIKKVGREGGTGNLGQMLISQNQSGGSTHGHSYTNPGGVLQVGSINLSVNNRVNTNIARDISPINIKSLDAPRLSHICLPFLSK